jgi:ubiquinone/menaquinone biosynthesis C-methylase UbiE
MPAGNFIPSLRVRILTPVYDTFLRVLMSEIKIKSRLIAQLDPNGEEKILDFGCGTGTLTLMIKQAGAGCFVYGIDIDPQVLEIAQRKARRDGVDVHLIRYDGVTLPFPEGNFDKLVSSLVLHHLSHDEKNLLLRELYRVLKKGGVLHVMDFGIQRSRYTKFITSVLKNLEPIEDNILGKIPRFLATAGFTGVEEAGYENTPLGSVSFYRAGKK